MSNNHDSVAVREHVRHVGGGMLALYDGDTFVREIGLACGWYFRDRDEFIVRYNAATQPQAASSTQAREIEDLAQSVEHIASCRDGVGANCDADCLRTAASMIRHLASTTPVSSTGAGELLRKIRDLLASRPADCLGEGWNDEGNWPIRDEVIAAITKALAQPAQQGGES